MTVRTRSRLRVGIGSGILVFGITGIAPAMMLQSSIHVEPWLVQTAVFVAGALVLWGGMCTKVDGLEKARAEDKTEIKEALGSKVGTAEFRQLMSRFEDFRSSTEGSLNRESQRISDLVLIRDGQTNDLKTQVAALAAELTTELRIEGEKRHKGFNDLTPRLNTMEQSIHDRLRDLESRVRDIERPK